MTATDVASAGSDNPSEFWIVRLGGREFTDDKGKTHYFTEEEAKHMAKRFGGEALPIESIAASEPRLRWDPESKVATVEWPKDWVYNEKTWKISVLIMWIEGLQAELEKLTRAMRGSVGGITEKEAEALVEKEGALEEGPGVK